MTMIERMARAIAALSDDEWNSLPDTKADWRASRYPDCRYKDDFRDDARAALTTLLEPSEGMVEAGAHMTDEDGDIGKARARGVVWSAIKAALDEKEG